MTNEEKIFRIEKIRKYEKEISDENKKNVNLTFSTGLSALAAAVCFGVGVIAKEKNAIPLMHLEFLFSFLNSTMVIYQFKNLLKSINRKTFLNIRIESINDELEIGKLEEEIKGRKKC